MFEVEAKVPISKKEYEALLERLKTEANVLGNREVNDTYYDKPKDVFIRMRHGGGEYEFNLKRRETIKGIESNIEMEWGISDAEAWKKCLKKIQIKPSVRKSKKSKLFKKDGFVIELNHVSKLGYYLEIERMVKERGDLAIAKKELVKLFNKLSFSQKQFEKRPYLELLSYV